MSPEDLVASALDLARNGDVEGAVALLRGADAPRDDVQRSLLFQLLSARARVAEAVEICNEALRAAKDDFSRSTWTLRRGLCHLEMCHVDAGARDRAVVDLQAVLKLKVNEDHVERAKKGLLEAAGIVKRM